MLENTVTPATRQRNSLVSARAAIAEARGQPEAALQLFAEAAEAWRKYGFAYEHAQALLGEARCLQQLGRADEARASLAEGRAILGRLGVDPLP